MKYAIVIFLFLAACQEKKVNEINAFSDDKLVNIYEMQDRRDAEGLIPFLKAKKESHRVAAALAFASIKDSTAIPYLNQMLQIDQDPMPRRAAAYALGQIGHSKALYILRSAFDGELHNDNRRYILEAIGKCGDSSTVDLFEKAEYQDSILRIGWAYGAFRLSLKGYTSDALSDRIMNLLNDDDQNLAILASHYVYRQVRKSKNPNLIDSLISTSRYKEVKDRFMLLKPKDQIEHYDIEWVQRKKAQNPRISSEPQLMAQFIDNLGPIINKHGRAYLQDNFNTKSVHFSIRNASFSKLCEVTTENKENLILDALKTNDMALQSLACYEIHKIDPAKIVSKDKWETRKTLLDQLELIKSQLKLPRQAETYIDVCKAIAVLGGKDFDSYKPEFNHPIDWDFVKSIPANQQVIIKTTKGDITLQCFINDAPGTVSNFLLLVDSGYYNNKFFHRVVPQFVVQGGCPRGDGWGGLDWTQRSEFSNYQNYKPGTVGIASAGLDTEGVQFFITHCSTPHLDGRYTIYARVIDGMSVVQKITVGDKILSIKRVETAIEMGDDC